MIDKSSLILVGISHHRTPIEIRERLFIPETSLLDSLKKLNSSSSLEECLILSTCNRVEVYAYTQNYEKCVSAIHDFFVEVQNIDPGILKKHLYVLRDEQVVGHLFRGSGSLDSMVIGEPQILGQVRNSFKIASENQFIGKNLLSLFSFAFRVAKKIREQTKIGKDPISVSSVSLDLAKKIFRTFEDRTVLLIGSGEMAESAMQHIVSQKPNKILVANRTYAHAQALASKYSGWAIDFENLKDEMSEAVIILTSTSSPSFIIDSSMVNLSLEVRKDRPMLFLDIAVPRNIDPLVNKIENIFLFDVDDLQKIASDNMKGREEESQEAKFIVEKEVQSFLNSKIVEDSSDILIEIRRLAENFRREEVKRTVSSLPDLDERVIDGSDLMTRAIIIKILHNPSVTIKEILEEGSGGDSIHLVKRLFGIEDTSSKQSFSSSEEESESIS